MNGKTLLNKLLAVHSKNWTGRKKRSKKTRMAKFLCYTETQKTRMAIANLFALHANVTR